MPKKLQPAIRTMNYASNASGQSTIDVAKDLSLVNRRGYSGGYQYGIQSVEAIFIQDPAVDTMYITVSTAGDSWSVHNAFVKSKALWNEMNQLVLEDNPSVAGKWADYKVYLDAGHAAAAAAAPFSDILPFNTLGPYQQGEWNRAVFVMPQHDVNPGTGVPDPALEFTGHLIGDDTGVASGDSKGLVLAYQDSRATMSFDNPNVPADFSNSFFNLLTDSGSQEPELANVIEDANDDPPYHDANYPGGSTNAPYPVVQDTCAVTSGSPNGLIAPFTAECGLIRVTCSAYKNGAPVSEYDYSNVTFLLNVAAGRYKGVAALPMGQ